MQYTQKCPNTGFRAKSHAIVNFSAIIQECAICGMIVHKIIQRDQTVKEILKNGLSKYDGLGAEPDMKTHLLQTKSAQTTKGLGRIA